MRSSERLWASTLALGCVAALFVFHPLTPAMPGAGLDAAWVAVMGEAAVRPARWGVDTVFTYGPAAPVVTGYYNAAWLSRTLPLQFGFAALFGWCAALLVGAGRPARTAALGTAAVGLMLAAARGTPDALFLTLPMLVLLLALRNGPGRAERVAPLVGAFALGLTAMVKMSFPLAALPLLAIGDGAGLARRRMPRLLPLFALGMVGGALLYGQHLADLVTYAAMQGEVVEGYAAAMAIDGPDWDLAPFLALAAALVVAVAATRRQNVERWPAAAGLGIALLFLFKAGFIRHDLHSLIAWTGLSLLATVLAWGWLPRRAAVAVTAAACVVVLVYEPAMTVRQSVRGGRIEALGRLYRGWMVDGPGRDVAALGELLGDPAAFHRRLDAVKALSWTGIADVEPLHPLPGTVDILPSEQTRVLASGLAYRGRPSFQEYSTYTAGLAEANRAFLAGGDAPRWMLFGPESPLGHMALDGRFPAFSEGALWPDLLRLYRPDHRDGALLALERRAAPAPLPFGPARNTTVGFGTFAPVKGDGPTWATLDIRLDLAGRALSALFRPPLLTLAVRLDDGTERRFRLVPALAAAGFLLSPLVENASDYEALAAGRAAGPGRRVVALAVEVTRTGRPFYAPDIGVTLRGMDLSRVGGGPAPAVTAWDALTRGAVPSDGEVRVPASGVLSLPVWGLPAVDGLRHMALRYGLGPGAHGLTCFAVRPADGTLGTLWRGCIEAEAGRHDAHTLALDVPEGVTELALQTTCDGIACDAYWRAPEEDAAR